MLHKTLSEPPRAAHRRLLQQNRPISAVRPEAHTALHQSLAIPEAPWPAPSRVFQGHRLARSVSGDCAGNEAQAILITAALLDRSVSHLDHQANAARHRV